MKVKFGDLTIRQMKDICESKREELEKSGDCDKPNKCLECVLFRYCLNIMFAVDEFIDKEVDI